MLSAKIASRNLPKRRARTILTVTAVFLGVALLVGINMATASALGEFNSYINKFWGATDIVVSYGNEQSFPNQTLSIVQNVRDMHDQSLVKETAERYNWFGATRNSASNVTFFLDGINPANNFDYASFNITGTRQFSAGQAVVDNTVAQKLNIGVGSSIDVGTILPAQNTSQFQPVLISLKVVGINYPLRNIGSTVYMYLPELQQTIGQQGKITHIYASLYDPKEALNVEKELLIALPSYYDVSAPKTEAVQRIDAQTTGFEIGLNVMIGVSLVVCAFIVFNTLFMTISERYYEIGILRAVGSSRGQIFRIFLAEGILIGALGTFTGIFGGLGLARLFTFILEASFDIPNLPVAQLTPSIVFAGLGSGFVSVLGGALYPATRASRVNIIQAIRPAARNSGRQIPLLLVGLVGTVMLGLAVGESLRLIPFHINYLDVVIVPVGLVVFGSAVFGKSGTTLTMATLPLSRSVRYIASRSGKRRLLRTTVCFGMIVITLSFAIMIGGIQNGVQGALQQGIQEALGADIILVANQSIPTSFTNNLTSLPSVASATPMSPGQFSAKAFGPSVNSTVGVLAVDPLVFPSIISYTFVGGSSSNQAYSQLTQNNQSLMMPDSLASKLGISVGDIIPILTPISNTTILFIVAGVFTGPVLQYIQFGEHFASDSIVVSLASQQKYFDGSFTAPLYLVDLKPQYKSQASSIAQDISTIYPKYDFSENSLTLGELLSLVNDTINRIFTLLLLILYFALLIASLGIGATMIMNVSDRRREIGLLRSQGMSRTQILSLFLGEGTLLGLFGFLLAIPGGLLLLKGATNSTTLAGFFIPYVVPYGAIVQAFFLALGAVLVGSVYPAIRASRMEITQALERA
ncbi:FtsX-like permease family protein [Candidatus Bathyarchaeota archaeon]|nr:FtsX-like permease family protein [Candidatus Bathyarchaeota archaeon]